MNIILDIDNTLLHTHDENLEEFEKLKLYSSTKNMHLRDKVYALNLVDTTENNIGIGVVTKLRGVYRPYLKDFLDCCLETFDNVIIWSAGRRKYVERVCSLLFDENQPYQILSYNDCKEGENGSCVKPLSDIFTDAINERNTLIIDDRETTFEKNKDNGILIPPFECEFKNIEKCKDVCLLKLILFFNTYEFKECKDVRKLRKDLIFVRSLEDYIDILEKEKDMKPNITI